MQVFGTQAVPMHSLSTHVWPTGHMPQLVVPPHRFEMSPQFLMPVGYCCAHVFVVHVALPQMFGAPPPPHVSVGSGHGGHVVVPPQPFGASPHSMPS